MHAKKNRDRSLKKIQTNKKKQNENKEYILGREFLVEYWNYTK